MKKLTLIFAAVMFIGITAASAQSPTSDSTKRSKQSTQKSGEDMSKDRSGDANKQGDRMLVRSTDIPASLRETLQGSSYTGWEKGQVYKTKSGEYLVEMKSNGKTTTHRFDASGQPIKE